MNFGKLLAAGKSLALGGAGVPYHLDKRVYLPKFVSPKNPFVKGEEQKPSTTNPVAAAVKTEIAMKTQKLPEVQKAATAWKSKLNPISIFRTQQSDAKRIATPVQTELSLEKVQVLRNDLSDADVEIVPLKSNSGAVQNLPPAEKSWEILGERLFGIRTF
jgi:hypothetical protein